MKEKNLLKNKKILIIQQRSWAKRIGRLLARQLSAKGAILGALTLKPKTHKFIINQKEVIYEFIESIDEPRKDPEKYLNGEKYSLEEICAELEIDSIWPYVNALRNHVRSFSEKHFYSFRQNVSDEEIILYIQAIYKMIKKIFKEFGPDIILTPNFVSLPHIMLNLYAEKKGVKMLATIDGKVRGFNIFIEDFQATSGRFFNRLGKLNTGKAESENRERAQEYIKNVRKEFKTPTYFEHFITQKENKTIWEKITLEFEPYYLSFVWYLKSLVPSKRELRDIDYIKSLGPTIDYRSPKYILREHYSVKNYTRETDNFNYFPLDKIDKFVYFPLQYQPESNIDITAPFFSNQIETARLIAMSLPSDYTLVAKDHPGMVGFRPPSYLEKIARTPNVKLVDYRIPTREIIERTDLVISPNSTTMAEAAFLYKPAIQLGDLGTTLVLPNAEKHTDMTTLSKKIKERLLEDLHTEEYERKLENYVAATYDTGFEFDYLGLWQYGKKPDLSPLWEAYKKEIIYLIKQ